ncbi:MAG: phospho-N-acetylmuramoyl-pentapeptide-transferase, partial [Prevotellaceae bacterium]|nr:phospho-N-acetylmuramoyl-pentapeptide-transferase [Prevotellaceae bacterium]
MLYYFFRFLDQFGIPGSHLWGYISFRAILALILSLVISAWFGEYFIKFLNRKRISETQRDVAIDPFGIKKIGVPSMGGIVIILSILVPALLLGRLRNIYMILMLVTTVWLGILGFADDYIKIFKKKKEGLHGKFKIIGQVGLGLIVGLTLFLSPDAVVRENVQIKSKNTTEVVASSSGNTSTAYVNVESKSTKTTIPFVKNNNLDYTDLFSFMGKYKNAAGWIFIVIMTILVITAVSNGANLNDGMDGMCAGT